MDRWVGHIEDIMRYPWTVKVAKGRLTDSELRIPRCLPCIEFMELVDAKTKE